MVRLRTKATDGAHLGDGPRYMPSLAQASDFGMDLLTARNKCRAKTGQPNVCVLE